MIDFKKEKGFDLFIYDHFEIENEENVLKVCYYFEIPGLKQFKHRIEIPKKGKDFQFSFVEDLVFHIGMVEAISYWKCCCPPKMKIYCGYLNEEQMEWFKKLYFHGLGEFFFRNGLQPDYDTFLTMECFSKKNTYEITYSGKGNLIAIGGGKDSCVTLDLLKEEADNSCFIINPKRVMLECAKIAQYEEEQILAIRRTLDPAIITLNEEGYLNGHTPFSAMVAFVSFLTAYLNGKKYIILSNEASANEANIKGTKVNHQYSKSYAFEKDFQEYTKKYFPVDITYFSLLRPLSEYQIGMLFSKIPQYHLAFKSCNPGSKKDPWVWCGDCPKCLFVFCLLSPFLYKDQLLNIFGQDLFEKRELLDTFEELLGHREKKPFDCVGTYEEINYAIIKTILMCSNQPLPYLLEYYKKHYPLDIFSTLEKQYNEEHSLNEHFENIVRKAIFDGRTDY